MYFYRNGNISIQPLGRPEHFHTYVHENKNFAGDCVYTTQLHFIDCLVNKKDFETNAKDYLQNIIIQDAVYHSAKTKQVVNL